MRTLSRAQMPVEGTYSIAGRGTVVTGRVESGRIRPGDEIEIVGLRKTQKTTVTVRALWPLHDPTPAKMSGPPLTMFPCHRRAGCGDVSQAARVW